MSRYDDDGGRIVPPSNGYENNGLGSTGHFADPGAADMAADDLKAILARISTQISDVERRHGDALDAMAERLSHMGGQAQTAKARAPVEYAQAFGRIEDSLADLAARIAHTSHGQQAEPAATPATEPAALPGLPSAGDEPAPVQSGGDVFKVSSADVPPDGSHTGAPAGNASPGEPWDQETADALASLYYPGGHDAAEDDLSTSEKVQFSLETERAWLGERFGNISELIEQSLSTIRPDAAVAALGQQLEDLEDRLAQALEGIGTQNDGEALRLVEMQISEMVLQLERSQSQLERLDSLEQHVGQIVDRVSEQRLMQIIEKASPAQQQPAVDEIAELTAERVAARMAEIVPPPAPAPEPVRAPEPSIPPAGAEQLNALHGVLENFFAERRVGEAQTVAALDAMHNVLGEVLARVHTLEIGAPPVHPSAPREYVREAVRFGNFEEQRPADLRVGEPAAPIGQAAPGHEQPMTAGPEQHEMPAFGEPEQTAPQTDIAFADDDQPTAVVSHEELPEHGEVPMSGEAAPTNRDDFIAAARRAARKASAQAAQAAEAMEEAQEAMPKAKKGLFSGDKRGPRPLVLVAAIGALAIAGFSLLYGNLVGREEAPPVAQRSSAKPMPMSKGLPAIATKPMSKAGGVAQVRRAVGAPIGKLATQRPAKAPKLATPKVPTVPGPPLTRPETMVERLAFQGRFEPATDPELPVGVVLQPFPAQGPEPVSPQQIIADKLPPGAVRIPISKAAIRRGAEVAPIRRAIPAAPVELALPPADVGPLSLRLAAAKGDPSAEFEVAVRYADGKGVERDYREAAAWYKRSAARGFAPSQYRLATLYERGIGVANDMGRARIWYKRAAQKGNVKAMHNLAVLTAGRSVGGPDYATAARWFQAAAERGLRDSQYNLGILLENGLGVSKSFVKSYQWFSLASRAGDKGAKRQLVQLKKRMSKTQIAQAKKAVKRWRAKSIDRLVNDPFAAGQMWKHRAKAAR